jgi:hypothetical protein
VKRTTWAGPCLFVVFAAATLAVVGCTKEKIKVTQTQDKPAAHDHSGWWCAEHGIPEAICGLCNTEYAAECQRKGDWCKEHDRPESQCFICHPELKEKFAEQYRTKYGKEPPPVESETPKKED